MALPLDLRGGFVPHHFTIDPPEQGDEINHLFQENRRAVVDELKIQFKELRAALYDGVPQNIYLAFGKILSHLNQNCGFFSVDEIIQYLRDTVDLLGDRLYQREFRSIVSLYLLGFIKVYTKIVMKYELDNQPRPVLDLYFINKIKEIYQPYFLGDHYSEWKETVISAIAEQGKRFMCTSYEFVDFVTNFTFMDVLFSNDQMNMEIFKEKILEQSKKYSFEFLRRLNGFEISLIFFNEVMKETVIGDITDEQVDIVRMYLESDRITIGKAADILKHIEGRCQITPGGWSVFLETLFKKTNNPKGILFLDVWKLMKFYFFIRKKVEIDSDKNSQFQKIYENKIRVILIDKIALNEIRSYDADQKDLVANLIEGLVLIDDLQTDTQKKALIKVLIGIVYLQVSVLKVENTYKFLENLAPRLQSNPEIDSLLLGLVFEFISQCYAEKPIELISLIGKAANLSLFEHSDPSHLLKKWNSLYEDFKILFKDEYFFVETLSEVLKISERELILHLFVQQTHATNLSAIKNKLISNTLEKVVPTDRELTLIQRYSLESQFPIEKRIDFINYVLCVYTLPEEVEEAIVRKILMSFVRTKNGKKLALTDIKGDLDVRYDPKKTDDIEYDLYKKVLRLLVQGLFVMDKTEFGKKHSKLLAKFLMHPFSLDGAIDNRTLGDVLEALLFFDEFKVWVESTLKLYGIQNNQVVLSLYINWISACNKRYISFRKSVAGINECGVDMFFGIKKSLHMMVIAAFNTIKEKKLGRTQLVSRYIISMNRPLVTDLLPEEPIMTIKKNKIHSSGWKG